MTKFRTKGQTELSEFMLKLIATMLFTVFLVGGILAISQFKAQINENADKRLSIDFGENVLAAPCLTEKKGLFNETRLNKEIIYKSAHPEDMDGVSCLNASALTAFKIKTKDSEWFFGSGGLESEIETSEFEFPAVLNNSDGIIVPAKLFAAVKASNDCNNGNEGLNCYNCMEAEKCEKEGCKWETGICEY
ncbi:MAG: hypothetical protein KKB25_00640 [Nanoarchaeota archaeon]|nr:hypothetical protein [Nanoarchaeota archaeon]